MKKSRRIAVFTGKRGGFGAMLRIMRGIQSTDGLELKVIASDMHLSATFGKTIDEVAGNVAVDATVDLGDYGDTPMDRTMAMGRVVQGLAPVLHDLRPDILLLLGDRGETLAAAMCAVEMGVTVAHIQAGDISGGIDDIHRHSITKLSHLHFSQNERQRQRVIRLGEAPERVWNTGAPYIDNIVRGTYPAPADALRSLGLDFDGPYYIMLHHSDTYRPEQSYDQAKAILNVLSGRPEHAIVVYPCSDPGYNGILRALDEHKDNARFHMFPSIEFLTFLSLMRGARALVGNSSSGILEAPYLHLPFVNVGLRQSGRDKAANVIDAEPDITSIETALDFAQTPSFRETLQNDDQPFGDGYASERILKVLAEVELGPSLYRKRITY